MTYLPVCSYGQHFWPKKKHLYYVGWGRAGDFKRYRLRFCAQHVGVVDEDLAEFEVSYPQSAPGHPYVPNTNCLSGGEPVSEPCWQVFVTGYPAQDQRKDYWAYLCLEHQLPEYLKDIYSAEP